MKKAVASNESRKKFLKQTMAIVLSASVVPSLARQSSGLTRQADEKKPPLASELVSEFVRVAHFDLNKVKEMLDKEPMLINATWDWGGGDWETGLGAASHMGRRDIANYLLEHGARLDLFAAAMLGKLEIVRAALEAYPEAINIPGPHGIPLIAHAQAGSNDAIQVYEYLKSLASQDTPART